MLCHLHIEKIFEHECSHEICPFRWCQYSRFIVIKLKKKKWENSKKNERRRVVNRWFWFESTARHIIIIWKCSLNKCLRYNPMVFFAFIFFFTFPFWLAMFFLLSLRLRFSIYLYLYTYCVCECECECVRLWCAVVFVWTFLLLLHHFSALFYLFLLWLLL